MVWLKWGTWVPGPVWATMGVLLAFAKLRGAPSNPQMPLESSPGTGSSLRNLQRMNSYVWQCGLFVYGQHNRRGTLVQARG